MHLHGLRALEVPQILEFQAFGDSGKVAFPPEFSPRLSSGTREETPGNSHSLLEFKFLKNIKHFEGKTLPGISFFCDRAGLVRQAERQKSGTKENGEKLAEKYRKYGNSSLLDLAANGAEKASFREVVVQNAVLEELYCFEFISQIM